MRYINNKYCLLVVIASLAITACEPEIDLADATANREKGSADFSRYVALGNSLTAGYADNALYREGQLNSYPAIMGKMMQAVNPELEFNQPLLPEGGGLGFSGTNVTGKIVFTGFNSNGTPKLEVTSPSAGATAQVQGPFQNLGVPGAKVGDLTLPGYGSALGNPYFARFASTQTTTIVAEAAAQQPSFFTLWIGNNDVLGYATSGGTGSITAISDFETSYKAIINGLVSANSSIEGALANIPNVENTPFFNTVPWNAFELSAEQAAALNAGLEAGIVPEVRKKVIRGVIVVGARRQIIRGVVEEGARRQIEAQAKDPVAAGVSEAIVYQQAYDQAKANNASDAEAAQFASAYVASTEGQQQIAGLKQQLLEGTAPDQAQAAYQNQLDATVEEQFATEAVQNQINSTYEAAIAADLEGDLAGVIGEEGATAVETVFNSADVQAQINQNYERTLQADEAGNLEAALGTEGAAAVESTQIAQLDQLKAAQYYPVFEAGANGFMVEDETSPTGRRQLVEGEKITLTFLTGNIASQLPELQYLVPDQFVLDNGELTNINEAIEGYNQVIQAVAAENTLALVDMNTFFSNVVNGGIIVNGTKFTNAYITGNAFSLDGIHLTQKGYGLVARKFIQSINSYYGSEIPLPNLDNYPSIVFPNN